MRLLDGIRILGPDDGTLSAGRSSMRRELAGAADTGDRWRFGEVVADPDEEVGTHLHPGEAEVIVILEGVVELHGSRGIAALQPGDVVFIPPDTEHGIRSPNGGRWLAVWPVAERVPGPRYSAGNPD